MGIGIRVRQPGGRSLKPTTNRRLSVTVVMETMVEMSRNAGRRSLAGSGAPTLPELCPGDRVHRSGGPTGHPPDSRNGGGAELRLSDAPARRVPVFAHSVTPVGKLGQYPLGMERGEVVRLGI